MDLLLKVQDVDDSIGHDADLHDREHERDNDNEHVQDNDKDNSEDKDNDNYKDDSNDIVGNFGDGDNYFDGDYTDSKNKPDCGNGVPNIDEEYGIIVKGNEEQGISNGENDFEVTSENDDEDWDVYNKSVAF